MKFFCGTPTSCGPCRRQRRHFGRCNPGLLAVERATRHRAGKTSTIEIFLECGHRKSLRGCELVPERSHCPAAAPVHASLAGAPT